MRQLMMMIAIIATIAMPATVKAQNLIPGTDWNGFYWGASAGSIWSDLEDSRDTADLVWSGHVGYGLQFSNVYIGGEWDVTLGGTTSSSALSPIYSSDLSMEWSTSARLRLGYTIGVVMPYVTGGFSWSRQTSAVYSMGQELTSNTTMIKGTVLGVGIEAILLPYISARIEALRFDHAAQNPKALDIVPSAISTGKFRDLSHEDIVVRAGVSIRF